PTTAAWPVVRRELDRLLAAPAERLHVAFTGGEPLLEKPLLMRAVRHVEARRRPGQRATCTILTNGLLVDRRTLSWLCRHAIEMQVSVDGIREAQDLREPGTFDRLDGLFGLMRDGFADCFRTNVSVAMTIVPQTVLRLADSVAYLIASGARRIRMSPAMDVHADAGGVLDALDAQFGNVARLSLAHARRTGHVPVTVLRKTPFAAPRAPSEWGCRAPLAASLTLDANGRHATCVVATETYTAGRRIRPALRTAIEALRLDPADGTLEDQRRAVTRRAADAGVFATNAPRHSDWGDCKDCPWVHACRVCPLMTEGEIDSRGSLKVPPLMCAFNQVAAKHREAFPIVPPPARTPARS
ncbi:MAG: hypothetical protein Q7V01_01460, partial [Vicinamibacterales bacterium]|nr:hypothetical protein [Vicinamibacterales bacterium]